MDDYSPEQIKAACERARERVKERARNNPQHSDTRMEQMVITMSALVEAFPTQADALKILAHEYGNAHRSTVYTDREKAELFYATEVFADELGIKGQYLKTVGDLTRAALGKD